MEFIWMIIIGGIAGALAKFLMPGDDPGGIIVTILIGIVGGILGGWLLGLLGIGTAGLLMTIIGAVIGAMVLLFIYRLIVGRRRHA